MAKSVEDRGFSGKTRDIYAYRVPNETHRTWRTAIIIGEACIIGVTGLGSQKIVRNEMDGPQVTSHNEAYTRSLTSCAEHVMAMVVCTRQNPGLVVRYMYSSCTWHNSFRRLTELPGPEKYNRLHVQLSGGTQISRDGNFPVKRAEVGASMSNLLVQPPFIN